MLRAVTKAVKGSFSADLLRVTNEKLQLFRCEISRKTSPVFTRPDAVVRLTWLAFLSIFQPRLRSLLSGLQGRPNWKVFCQAPSLSAEADLSHFDLELLSWITKVFHFDINNRKSCWLL